MGLIGVVCLALWRPPRRPTWRAVGEGPRGGGIEVGGEGKEKKKKKRKKAGRKKRTRTSD
jgi:hypothetical protein